MAEEGAWGTRPGDDQVRWNQRSQQKQDRTPMVRKGVCGSSSAATSDPLSATVTVSRSALQPVASPTMTISILEVILELIVDWYSYL